MLYCCNQYDGDRAEYSWRGVSVTRLQRRSDNNCQTHKESSCKQRQYKQPEHDEHHADDDSGQCSLTHDHDNVEKAQHLCIDIKDSEDEEQLQNSVFKIFREAKNAQQRELYKCFLLEYKAAFKSKEIHTGCEKCDDTVVQFQQMKDFTSYELNKRLTFKPNKEGYGGRFQYDREHSSLVECLPTGAKQASARLLQTSEKLQKLPFSMQYLNYGLAYDYLNKFTRWLNDVDPIERKDFKTHLIALTIVRNLNSSTTTLRICKSANSKHQSLCGVHCPCHKKKQEQSSFTELHNAKTENEISKTMDTQNIDCKIKISLNDCLKVYPQELPSILSLALSQRTAMICAGSDVSKYFKQILQTTEASMKNGALVFKDRLSGLPTFEKMTKGGENKKEILLFATCGFGLADLPPMSTAVGAQIVPTFAKHLEKDENVQKYASQMIKAAGMEGNWITVHDAEYNFVKSRVLKSMELLYVDDHIHNIGFLDSILFLQCKGADIMQCKESDFMAAALQLQLKTAQYTILAMHFAGFSFKSYMTNTENNSRLNKLVQLCKPNFIEPEIKKPTFEQIKSEHIKGQTTPVRQSAAQNIHEQCSTVQCSAAERKSLLASCDLDQQAAAHKTEIGEDPSKHADSNPKPYLQTLGVKYFDEYCTIRCESLKLTDGSSKTKRILCNNVHDFDKWFNGLNGNFTRKHCAILLGQMYSQNSGLHFIFAVTVIKFLIGVSARAGIQWEWNSPVPENYLYLARVAVILFFKASEEKQVRCSEGAGPSHRPEPGGYQLTLSSLSSLYTQP